MRVPRAALVATLAVVSACSGGAPAPSPSAAAAAAAAAGAASGDAGRPVKLAFVTNNTSEFWKIAGDGVHKYESRGQGPGRHQDAAQRQDRGAEPDPREPGRARATTRSRSA